jgi:hypothetical protein
VAVLVTLEPNVGAIIAVILVIINATLLQAIITATAATTALYVFGVIKLVTMPMLVRWQDNKNYGMNLTRKRNRQTNNRL